MIDAGHKTLGTDSVIGFRDAPDFFRNGYPTFGSIQGRPDLWLGCLSAETSCIYYMDRDSKKRLHIGDQLEIVPNNATLVINIHDVMCGVRNGVVERMVPVTGRGRDS